MTPARISGMHAERPRRPVLVSVLAGAWLLFAAVLAAGATLALAKGAGVGEERVFAALSLLLASLVGAGALGLLRRQSWARAALASGGLAVLLLSGLRTYRVVSTAAAPAAALAESEPDAANALALFRAGSAILFLVQALPLVLALSLLRHPKVRDWANPGAREAATRRGPDVLVLAAVGAVAVAALSFFLSKKSPSPGAPAQQAQPGAPGPAETFSWSGQPIAFVPPGEGWTRERHAEGRRKGVSFTRYATPPSRIVVAEALLDTAARTADEILPRFRLTSGSFPSADSATVSEPVRAEVGGVPAFRTDYMLRERSMEHQGRELLAVAGGHAFVLTFLGRGSDVAAFESLVASVRFPVPGSGEGAVRTASEAPRDEMADGAAAELRVGSHRLTVRPPAGWERVDYGERQEFRYGETRIALADGGELPLGATELDDERLVARALRLFGHDPRRWEIGAKTRLSAAGGEALALDTREPLSHVPHARVVLFVHRGRLLALGPVMGSHEATRAALDALVASVRFLD